MLLSNTIPPRINHHHIPPRCQTLHPLIFLRENKRGAHLIKYRLRLYQPYLFLPKIDQSQGKITRFIPHIRIDISVSGKAIALLIDC